MKKIYIFSLLTFSSLISCQGYSITGGPGKTVAPSLMSNSDHTRDLLTVNSIFVSSVEVADEARLNAPVSMDFSSLLQDAVQNEISLKVFYSKLEAKQNPSTTSYVTEAKKVSADATLVTRLHNFVARQGSALGSERPAQIDLTMLLVRAKDGQTIWQSSYHYKDQALSDNLFRLGDKLKGGNAPHFKDAEDLLMTGYRSALSDFASRRLSEFSTNQ